ncbi:hypothetical protein I2483_13675 [Sporosarcina sp. E16_3]|uniref:phBC6A51 family helix-turn-helix protein n=1 Tax=Sporosarcina sp. E16_3 TaxID=2789293 RepID=UPI001A919AD9|nr:phBC6A51 family helix-turn-helix protein [Sporosarcina sp. E16_3]MBO0602712.1 hypothetical protein [Sporosarcina sp. E16_3]
MAKLHDKQIAAIALLSLPKRGGMTFEQVADAVGVDRKTLLEWRKRDDFNDELKREIVRATLDSLPDIMASIPRHIIDSGNAALFRTLLQAHGLLTDKIEVDTKGTGTDIDAMKAQIERMRGVEDGK